MQAAADANNSPDEWANTYAPEGMSRFTQMQEEAHARAQARLDSETETDADGDEPLFKSAVRGRVFCRKTRSEASGGRRANVRKKERAVTVAQTE